jgi:hypothetical protein
MENRPSEPKPKAPPRGADWLADIVDERKPRPLRWSVAILLAALLHLGALVVVTEAFDDMHNQHTYTPERTFELVMEEPEEPELPRFVEANPDVPDNLPDTTDFISDRNQQAAQEEPVRRSEDPIPFVDGEEPDSQKIVEGSLDNISVPILPEGDGGTSPDPTTAEEDSAVTAENTPATPPSFLPPPPLISRAPDFLQGEEDNEDPDGVGFTQMERDSGETETEDPRDDTSEGRVIHLFPQFAEQPPQPPVDPSEATPDTAGSRRAGVQPLPRPTLGPRVIEGPRMLSERAAPRVGTLAIDTTFSEFGEYQQRMMEVIQRQWHILAREFTLRPEDSPSRVQVRFTLTRDGDVRRAEVINTSAGRVATIITVDAIESRSPFGPWTSEMVAVYGEETEIRIQFIYW